MRPVGWHTRSASSPNTRRLLIEEGGFLYDSDAYNDDLPYALALESAATSCMPYAFDTNDMQFQNTNRFRGAADFADYVLEAFEWLHREGASAPKMMSIGLHLRMIGRPGRIGALDRILGGDCAQGRRLDRAPRRNRQTLARAHPANGMMGSRPRLLIVNPNTNLQVTGWLREEAARAAADDFDVTAVNAASGLAAIQTPDDSRKAAQAVADDSGGGAGRSGRDRGRVRGSRPGSRANTELNSSDRPWRSGHERGGQGR